MTVHQVVTIRFGPKSVTGQVLPPHPGKPVFLMLGDPEAEDEFDYSEVARTRLSPTSRFRFRHTRLPSGSYHVLRPADRDHGAGRSEEFRLGR
jgi:hypothetical protein